MKQMRTPNRTRMFALLVLGCSVFDIRLNRFFSGLGQALSDIKVYLFALMCFTQLLGMSFQSFFPTYVLHFFFMSVSRTHMIFLGRLTSTLGYNTTISLLLAAPPWIFATVVCCINAWHAGRSPLETYTLPPSQKESMLIVQLCLNRPHW